MKGSYCSTEKKAINPHPAHEKTPPASKKKLGRERKEHEGESDDADGVKVTPPPQPTITTEVPAGEANKVDVF
jgi:hypothetical protein